MVFLSARDSYQKRPLTGPRPRQYLRFPKGVANEINEYMHESMNECLVEESMNRFILEEMNKLMNLLMSQSLKA